jgi:hypothetical protein
MRELTQKEENIIEDIWTAFEQWDDCAGNGEASLIKCEKCPFIVYHYDARYGTEFYQCIKTLIEEIHEEMCT